MEDTGKPGKDDAHKDAKESNESVMRTAASAATYNILLQVGLRVLTFALNGFLLRCITRDTLGVVNVRLTLLYTTCLFLSREGFRKACINYSRDRWHQVNNIIWLSVPFGVVTSFFFGYIWAYKLEQPGEDLLYYHESVALYCIAVVIELLAEPAFIFCQVHLFVGARVLIEGLALTVRCVLTVALVLLRPDLGLLLFGIAQCLFSIILVLGYYAFTRQKLEKDQTEVKPLLPIKGVGELLPHAQASNEIVPNHESVMPLVVSFFKQSLVKQLLTEGERYIMTLFAVIDFGEQGVFDVISNLGALVARFLFSPIEESYYLFFTKVLDRNTTTDPTRKAVVTQNVRLAGRALQTLLKFGLLVGLVFVCYGPSYTRILLDLYGGSNLSAGTGPYLLSWYCVYVLLLALNGVGECFVSAASNPSELDVYNRLMVVFSVVFLVSSLIFTRSSLGAAGFIAGNCVNMSMRISYAVVFIRRYFRKALPDAPSPLLAVLPDIRLAVALGASAAVTWMSALWLEEQEAHTSSLPHRYRLRAIHIAVGAVCLLATAAIAAWKEKEFFRDLRSLWKGTLTVKTD
eukprot:comp7428_c1_seq1/m.3099 comp7428_c1_seq1/g.3099  ORF comp7428_c1_seq1/g.3099 comp7428_c1_seq1/m.3099 type:complete len:574 (-) comp7428_c1_seq1:73-1794(-)